MKRILTILLFVFSLNASAQELETIYLNENITTHFLSRVHISQIDLSTDKVAGKLSNKKILAIKPIGSAHIELGVLSIIGQDFFVQYRLIYTNDLNLANKKVIVEDAPENHFLNPNYEMTNIDMYAYAKKLEALEPTYHNVAARDNRAVIKLNNIIVKDHFIFIDYSIQNKTNLIYDVDDIKYTIDDKKITRNTNVQRLIVEPEFQLNNEKTFKDEYRNIVCFEKMTFPDKKEFVIELSEEQISGRTIKLSISYMDVLNADTL